MKQGLRQAGMGLILAGISCLAPVVAIADAPSVPPLLTHVEGLTYEGEISGLDAWHAPGADFLWLQAPDGVGLVAAFVFNGRGQDIGSMISGVAPVDITSLMQPPPQASQEPDLAPAASPAGAAAGLAATQDQQDLHAQAQAQAAPSDVAVAGLSISSVMDEDQLANLASAEADLQGQTAEPSMMQPQAAIAMATSVVEGLPEDVKSEVLIDLVEMLQAVKTEDEFKAAIAQWRLRVAEAAAKSGQGAPSQAAPGDDITVSGVSEDPQQATDSGTTPMPEMGLMPSQAQTGAKPVPAAADPLPEPAPTTVAPVDAVPAEVPSSAGAPEANAGPVAPVAAVDGAAKPSAVAPDVTFLENSRLNTMWFSVGARSAPVVYAYIDPTCPHCANAVKSLKGEIDAGRLQMRVILAPLVSDSAPSVIAGIMSAPDPVKAFFDNEIARAEKRSSPVQPVDFAKLPETVQKGIRTNYQMVIDHGVPGVPFFVFKTAEGEDYVSGEPEPDSFKSALPDSYTGTQAP